MIYKAHLKYVIFIHSFEHLFNNDSCSKTYFISLHLLFYYQSSKELLFLVERILIIESIYYRLFRNYLVRVESNLEMIQIILLTVMDVHE